MKLPLLVSVPHAGLRVPPEARPYCLLTRKQIRADGDGGAAEIYHRLRDEAAAFVTTEVARAIIDPNRAEDDRRPDGVVKTHTCWDEPVYRRFPPPAVVETLLARYYRPYHRQLRELARTGVHLGLDCHTMAEIAPPIATDPGARRPWVCLSNDKRTCPSGWLTAMAEALEQAFEHPVAVNEPFRGGFIVRSRPGGIPWMQLELSRGAWMAQEEKRRAVRDALGRFCDRMKAQHWRPR